MNPSEAATILAKMAAYDQRTVGEADALAWAEALDGQVTVSAALEAVTAHYRKSRDRMMPVDVILAVREARGAILRRMGAADPPIGLGHEGNRKWHAAYIEAAVATNGDRRAAHAAGDRAAGITRSLDDVREIGSPIVQTDYE